jgi:hypothetical protein
MKTICLIPLLFLSACSTKPKLALRPLPQPSPVDAKSIRYPEVLHAYHVGRYADPNNDWVMHEQHVVYRVEGNSRWDFHPGNSVGSNLTASQIPRDAAFAPFPVNDAILAEINSQRLATAQIMVQTKVLSGALQQLQAALQVARTNEQAAAGLRAAMDELRKRLDTLESARGTTPITDSAVTNTPSGALSP